MLLAALLIPLCLPLANERDSFAINWLASVPLYAYVNVILARRFRRRVYWHVAIASAIFIMAPLLARRNFILDALLIIILVVVIFLNIAKHSEISQDNQKLLENKNIATLELFAFVFSMATWGVPLTSMLLARVI